MCGTYSFATMERLEKTNMRNVVTYNINKHCEFKMVTI